MQPVLRRDDPEEYKRWQRGMHAAERKSVPVEAIADELRSASWFWEEDFTEPIRAAFNKLQRRERLVLWLRYGDDPQATQVEVAAALSCTERHARRIEANALRLLHAHLVSG